LKEAVLLSTKGGFSMEDRVDILYFLTRAEEFVEAGFVIARQDISSQIKNRD
jgi:hypothetical protein